MESYENAAFQGHDQSSLQLRNLLGWKSAALYSRLPPHLLAVPELKSTSPPTTTSHEECFALVNGYALIDRWAQLVKVQNLDKAAVVPKKLDNALLQKVKVSFYVPCAGDILMQH